MNRGTLLTVTIILLAVIGAIVLSLPPVKH